MDEPALATCNSTDHMFSLVPRNRPLTVLVTVVGRTDFVSMDWCITEHAIGNQHYVGTIQRAVGNGLVALNDIEELVT